MTLPALGESVTEGTVTQWLKQVGDDVAVDEPLLEISTDKVDTEIPSPVAGKLLEIKVAEDETVEVGAELAIIGSADAAAPADRAPETPAADPQPAADPEPVEPPNAPSNARRAGARARARAGSRARTRARARARTDPEPRSPRPRPHPAARSPHRLLRPLRDRPTRTSRRSCASSPSSTASTSPRSPAPASADASASRTSSTLRPPSPQRPPPSGALRSGTCRRRRRAVAAARQDREGHSPAQDHRNAHGRVARDLGPADAGPRGRRHRGRSPACQAQGRVPGARGRQADLPAVLREGRDRGAQALPRAQRSARPRRRRHHLPVGRASLASRSTPSAACWHPRSRTPATSRSPGLARKIADVADRTRNNKILPDELSGGTFSITNLGSNGALFDTPIINQPQVAILGVGAVVKRPVVITDPSVGESIAVRSMAYLALTYDHRLVDGADAGRFLTAVKQRLQAGAFEVELGS